MTLRETPRKFIPLAVCGVVATVAVAVVMTRHDTAAATSVAVTAEALVAAAVALPIENSATALIGADPDPTAFDREGLEWWWRNYQRSHRQAAAN